MNKNVLKLCNTCLVFVLQITALSPPLSFICCAVIVDIPVFLNWIREAIYNFSSFISERALSWAGVLYGGVAEEENKSSFLSHQ